jgi:DNA-binding CsgD family transcriptional regulator
MERESGRVEAIGASAPPTIISWDPLVGDLLRGHLETEGFDGAVHVPEIDPATVSTPVVLVPPPNYADYLGSGWDSHLRAVPLEVPLVVLARPHVPVRSALQLNQRTSGVALLDSSRPSTVGAVASALRMTIEGGQVIDPLFIASDAAATTAELTPAELRVYGLLANGRSNKGIADELFLSERTVEVHVRKILAKLGLEDNPAINRRVVAASMFLDQG